MSYENKGSMVSSVVVAQDGTGNFHCTGANDQVELLLAINHANDIGVNHVSVKAGTYDLQGLTIATDVVLVGVEEGVVFSLPVQPSITVTTAVDYIVFERITFLSTLDDADIIRFNPVKGTFRYCKFDLQLDTLGDDGVIYYTNNVDASDIIFEQCELVGGKAGASGFGFFIIGEDMGSMIIRHFRITNITCDTTAGVARLWTGDNTKICDLLVAEEITWEYLTAGGGTDSAFIYSNFRCNEGRVDGFYFLDGNLANNHQMSPTGAFATHMQCSNFICLKPVHSYSGRQTHQMDNILLIGTQAVGSHWDLQSGGESEKYATITNCYFYDASLDINSQWKKTNISNCMFRGSRIWIGDEGTSGVAREVYVDNCQWQYHANAYKNNAFEIDYTDGLPGTPLNLEKLSVSNCHIKDFIEIFLVGALAETQATHIILENVTVTPEIDNNWPALFSPAGRFADSEIQIIEIYDSDIVTNGTPLNTWNPILANDKFDNVRWWDIDDNAWYYSERGGKDTIANGAAAQVVAHELVISPDTWGYVQITGAEDHVECTSLLAHTVGAVNFTCQFRPEVGGPNVTADRDFYWYAHIKP